MNPDFSSSARELDPDCGDFFLPFLKAVFVLIFGKQTADIGYMCFVCWMDDLKNLQTSGYFLKKLRQVKVHCKCNQHHLSIYHQCFKKQLHFFFPLVGSKLAAPKRVGEEVHEEKKEKVNQLTGSSSIKRVQLFREGEKAGKEENILVESDWKK